MHKQFVQVYELNLEEAREEKREEHGMSLKTEIERIDPRNEMSRLINLQVRRGICVLLFVWDLHAMRVGV